MDFSRTDGRCTVAILAGGQGTRLSTRSGNLPKPMVPVLGVPLLQHQIERCREAGFMDVALLVHFRHEVLRAHFGDGSAFGVRIRYLVEKSPRGTAGALRDALPCMAERFLVLYGDTYFDVDLRRLWDAHARAQGCATMFLHPNDHPDDSDLVALDAQGFVERIFPYPHTHGSDHRNLVNAALYVLERKGLDRFAPAEGKGDIAKDMFPALIAAGRRIFGYVSPEYIKDMGTPQRLDRVELDIVAGLPDRLSARGQRAAVFLDRDGTMIEEVGHLKHADQVILLPGAGAAIRRLNRSGRLSVVVTNQPVIARGEVSPEGLELIHARMESLLGGEGAYIDRLYYCPHHPDRGFAGEVAALKMTCECRKPAPGMLDRACRELDISRTDSWMVGDSAADVEAGRNAGVRTILVRTGHAGAGGQLVLRPDYVVHDLTAAVDWILEGHARTARALLPLLPRLCRADVRVVLVAGPAGAGKSSAMQVLKEQLKSLGRTAHVITLDAWLRPSGKRREGAGVLARYDLAAAGTALAGIASSRGRETLATQIYDRSSREFLPQALLHSIGPDDLLIVEGVPAFHLMPYMGALSSARVFIDVDEPTRRARLQADYALRGVTAHSFEASYCSRMVDEVAVVRADAKSADFIVTTDSLA